MPKVSLSGMTVEALMDLRRRVDEILAGDARFRLQDFFCMPCLRNAAAAASVLQCTDGVRQFHVSILQFVR
jgi:hypothetical protein